MTWCWRCRQTKNGPFGGVCWACYMWVRRHNTNAAEEAAEALNAYWPEWAWWRQMRRAELARLNVAATVAANELQRFFIAKAG